jgi:hypothetical protein
VEYEKKMIVHYQNFDEIQEIIGKNCSKALLNSSTPFESGKTKYFAYENIIFEVFVKNNYLNSITIF